MARNVFDRPSKKRVRVPGEDMAMMEEASVAGDLVRLARELTAVTPRFTVRVGRGSASGNRLFEMFAPLRTGEYDKAAIGKMFDDVDKEAKRVVKAVASKLGASFSRLTPAAMRTYVDPQDFLVGGVIEGDVGAEDVADAFQGDSAVRQAWVE